MSGSPVPSRVRRARSPDAPTPPILPRDLHCPRCSYNLTGLKLEHCPECGEPVTLRRLILVGRLPSLPRGSTYGLLLIAPAVALLGFPAMVLLAEVSPAGPTADASVGVLVVAVIGIAAGASLVIGRRFARALIGPTEEPNPLGRTTVALLFAGLSFLLQAGLSLAAGFISFLAFMLLSL